MFRKILIANRGEIGCRVAATARRLGIATVAVYSDADRGARHVAMADEAVRLGPAPTRESYLRGDLIVAAALQTGAEAIHPGYGFLSENPDFAEAVAAAGLVFIGPPASAIRAMGLKDAAKRLMEAAGVPVVPGYHGDRQDAGFLAAEADRIGYPVLIKARAGGGGKGMRLVEHPGHFAMALEAARREAAASFGEPACLLERYITPSRHIEIQVLADGAGRVVHLFERDCSLQRRHQKVIEEAPAPGMTAEVRAALGRAAVEAARAIGYRGAGTVEFIADGSGPLRPDGVWFMEMNTRLQVEHPVTEAITGLDLVELQLRVAAGEPLPFAQDDLTIRGHAVEARIYAEDVARGFLPAPGRIEHLHLPEAAEFTGGPVRIDAGVREGDWVTPHYDPMIGKLIVHAANRGSALDRLTAALAEVRIAGPVTNVAFLAAIARHQGFRSGAVDTGLIGRDLGHLAAAPPAPDLAVAIAALAALGLLRATAGPDPWDSLTGWRHWSEARYHAHLEQDGRQIAREVIARGAGRYRVEGGAAALDLAVERQADGSLRVIHDGHLRHAHAVTFGDTITVFLGGDSYNFTRPDEVGHEDEDGLTGDLVAAPLPGRVKLVAVEPGRRVARGDALVVIEAMKMEHTLTAPRAGTVGVVMVAADDQVAEGAVLVALAPEAEAEAEDG